MAVYTDDGDAEFGAFCSGQVRLLWREAQSVHTGFDLEVHAIFTFFNGCVGGADPPPLLDGAQAVYLWFEAPF